MSPLECFLLSLARSVGSVGNRGLGIHNPILATRKGRFERSNPWSYFTAYRWCSADNDNYIQSSPPLSSAVETPPQTEINDFRFVGLPGDDATFDSLIPKNKEKKTQTENTPPSPPSLLHSLLSGDQTSLYHYIIRITSCFRKPLTIHFAYEYMSVGNLGTLDGSFH